MAHVVSAVLGASGPLLLKLADLIAGRYGGLKRVRKRILALNLELSSMHAAVEKYMMEEDPDIQVKQWISMVRELAYDTEDCIDKFIHWLGNGRLHGGFKESFHRFARCLKMLGARSRIADQIDELMARIKQVKELKDSLKLDDASSSNTGHADVDPRLHALFAEEAHLVGLDGPRNDLAKWMVEEGSNTTTKLRRMVLSIVGFGGLGKTTLANAVYHKIQECFDCCAFVSVSQKPDIKRIIKDVISQVSSQDGFTQGTTNDWDERKSIENLRVLLQDKRYLIIIDDIWSTEAWNNIQCAFPENNCSSRIIATTRIIDIAKSCCLGTNDRIYKIGSLSDLHARELFFKRIFTSNDSCPDMLEEVSNKILKKCGGLPLAITIIAGLLARKLAVKEEWEKVETLIGSGLENDKSLEGISSILLLSYYDLPPNLKTCLLYLSVFPEDYVITRERLMRRWIAEGFISKGRGRSQYEVAESYFYELINRSIVHPVDIGHDSKVRACRLHDMMLEIIISKSAEYNFVTLVGKGNNNLSNSHGFIRRLSVQYIDQDVASALANTDLSHVRSLTVTASNCITHLPCLVEFEALRVLDFEGCNGMEKYDMNNIGKLFQLKYIGLKGTTISKLPSQIVMLCDLETLDFRETSVQQLPTRFVQLTKLHQLLAGRETKIPSRIWKMRDLRVISGFNATMSPADALVELGNLTSLSELSIYLECQTSECRGADAYKVHEERLLSSLYKLIGRCKLRSLHIDGKDGHSLEFLESWSPLPSDLQNFRMATGYYFTDIPKWIAPALTNLASLDIKLTKLTEDDLQTLGELPALLCLILTLEIGENKITVPGIGFPSLICFEIFSNKGTYVTFVKGAMPRLEYIEMVLSASVGRNYGYYLGIVHLPCFKKAYLRTYCHNSSEVGAVIDATNEELRVHRNYPRVIKCGWKRPQE